MQAKIRLDSYGSKACHKLFSTCYFVHTYTVYAQLENKRLHKDNLANEQLLYYQTYLFYEFISYEVMELCI